MKKEKRFVVIKLQQDEQAWCVDDTETNRTKAVFYDEASEKLARDFCRQINGLVDKSQK
jgi:hypothetical protein